MRATWNILQSPSALSLSFNATRNVVACIADSFHSVGPETTTGTTQRREDCLQMHLIHLNILLYCEKSGDTKHTLALMSIQRYSY